MDVAQFVNQCLTCQQVKVEHQKLPRTLKPLHILEWKWEHISMDFVTGLPKALNGQDAIWVVVDQLTKSTHFIPFKTTCTMDQVAEIYV
jgi:hypothetical protein